ncbi:MAG: acyl-CoA dehydrogenase [Alphaproteobacteria bacterium]|nr:MAG: acyl-CoA dehydrogenase [Alphaproteobacteria bacterium]
MEKYVAPLEDMSFILTNLLDIDNYLKSINNKELSFDSLKMIIEEAGKFACDELDTINQIGDQEGIKLENGVVRMPESFIKAYKKFVNTGWFSIIGEKKYGGQDLPLSAVVMINEIWHSTNMSFATNNMLTQGAVELLESHGNEKQKEYYLPNLISGKWSGTMNLTEPHAGSDLSSIKTKAIEKDKKFLIKGTKIYITHGDQDMSDNIIHLVLAKLPNAPDGVKGISLFLVPKYYLNDKGTKVKNDIKVVSVEHKLGHHASPTCVLSFGENEGAIGELVGEPNQGLKAMFTMMNNARLNVGVQGLAISERAYQKALSFSKERIQGYSLNKNITGPVEIIKHPDVKRMLMEMKSQTEAMRGLAITTGNFIDKYKNFPNSPEGKECLFISNLLTPIVKAWCTDQSIYITSLGVQVHGGMGFIEDTGAAQYYRDCRILAIYEGTNGIQALDLLRRKLFQENGETYKKVLQIIKNTAELAIKSENNNLKEMGELLFKSLDIIEDCSVWLIDKHEENPEISAAGATPFLNMFGWVLGGWVMVDSANKAQLIILKDKNNKFAKEKINTASFFCNTYLPLASSLQNTIKKSFYALENFN